MQFFIKDEVQQVHEAIRQNFKALGDLRHKTGLCARQDPEQLRLIERIKSQYFQLKLLDINHGAEYEKRIDMLQRFPDAERPKLRRVA